MMMLLKGAASPVMHIKTICTHGLQRLACLAGIALALLLAAQSPLAMQGAREGLALCGQVIIPSLYPFFVLGALFAGQGAWSSRGGRGMHWLFRQPPAALGVLLLGLLGGYPLGAKTAAQLFEQGQLTRSQAQRLQLFCVNAGPAYLLGAVGSGLLGSRKAGLLLLISLAAAGLAVGLMTRVLAPVGAEADTELAHKEVPAPRRPFDSRLLGAVSNATGSILSICAWVVLFSTLCALLRLLPAAFWSTIPPLNVFLEVSSGAASVVRDGLPLPVLCAALGWGGLSVHCQIWGDLRKTGLKPLLFWVARLLHGALAAAFCTGLLRWFPIELRAAAVEGAHQQVRLWTVSVPAAAALLLFCAFLILDLDLNRKMC